MEVANAVWRHAVRGLMQKEQARARILRFTRFNVTALLPDGLHEEALDIADRFNRPPIYDAYYVALGRTLNCEVWTADRALLNALGTQAPWVRWIGDYPAS